MITPEEIQAAVSALPHPLPDMVCPTIATRTGRMKCSSLRPGDWIQTEEAGVKVNVVVLINSAKLKTAVLAFGYGTAEVPARYETFRHYSFLSHSKRRPWHRFLPKWIRKNVCEFARP